MGDANLTIIPEVPDYIPEMSSQLKARKILETIYSNKELSLETSNEIQFVDQGENLESVSCNICGKQLQIEEWQTLMGGSYKQQFKDLSFITPCCKNKTFLNELTYNTPAGFSKFKITILNPDVILTETELSKLENILGTKLKTIIAKI
jgi:hypothetical protein